MTTEKIKDAIQKLVEINKIITNLDPAIRESAFDILAPLFFKEAPGRGKRDGDGGGKKDKIKVSTADKEEFLASFEHKKPKDNLLLIVAWLYSQYGVFPISRRIFDEEASNAGLTVPERPDNTMRYAKHNGKNLFRKKGAGWQLTVSGEAYLKETYSVKKGNKPAPEEDAE